MSLKRPIRRFWNFLERENLVSLFWLIITLIGFGAVAITWFEPGVKLYDGLWWSVVTLTTVGYGDISPASLGGRLVAAVLMFFGVGLVGLFSATIAGTMVAKKMNEERGMNSYKFKNHIILCEWNHRAWVIFNEFRADPQTEDAPIVVIADLDHKPVNDENLFFVQGSVTDETLQRANLAKARTAVILGNDEFDPMTRDAKVVLTTLTVETLNPDVYTIVELVDEANIRHCQRANADEIIVTSELNSSLIARTALNHGISRVVSELVRTGQGNDLYKVGAPEFSVGQTFIEVFTDLKRDHQCIVLAVQKGIKGEVISNPANDYILEQGDYLMVISKEKPKF